MLRRLAFITITLITAAILWPAPVSAQQFFPAGRREVTLSTGFISGGSSFSLNLAYGLPASPLDLLFRVTSLSSGGTTATGFLFGGRYYFAPTPVLRPYVVAGFSSVSVAGFSSSALVIGGGASLDFPGPLSAYGSLLTNTTGGGLGYDVGIRYALSDPFSLLVGVSGSSSGGVSSSAGYVGVGFRF